MYIRRWALGALGAGVLGMTGCHSSSTPATPKPTPVPTASACPSSAPISGALAVTTLADAGAGSLRDTLASAPANSTIAFAAALAGKTIALTTGPLAVSASPVTIQGPCPNVTVTMTASGAGQHMIAVGTNVNATINNITFTSINAPAFGAATGARVVFNAVSFTGSKAPNCAAIDGSGNARIFLSNSLVTNNTATGDGILCNSGELDLNTTAVSKNTTGGYGALYNTGSGTTSITASDFDTNAAANGGAIAGAGGLVGAINSTFYANTATQAGGAVYAADGASVSLNYATVSANTSASAQAVASAKATLTLHSTLISNAPAGENDTAGPIVSAGYNFVSSPGSATGFVPSDILGQSVPLFAFGGYGGPTNSRPPMLGAKVIDAADPRNGECPFVDQRGIKRPQGPACDIGAIEYDFTNPP